MNKKHTLNADETLDILVAAAATKIEESLEAFRLAIDEGELSTALGCLRNAGSMAQGGRETMENYEEWEAASDFKVIETKINLGITNISHLLGPGANN